MHDNNYIFMINSFKHFSVSDLFFNQLALTKFGGCLQYLIAINTMQGNKCQKKRWQSNKEPWEQGYVVSGIYDHFIGVRYLEFLI